MGAWVAGAAAIVALVSAFVLRPRLSAVVTVPLLVAASAALAWGGMLLQEDPSAMEWALAVGVMAVMGPLHVRIVLGPYGPRG